MAPKPIFQRMRCCMVSFSIFFINIFIYSYFFMPIVFPEILVYIMVMLLSAIDFWVVKNVVGRKLIKMRWWYLIDNEGNERWHFESRGNISKNSFLFRDQHFVPRPPRFLGYSLCDTFSVGTFHCNERTHFCNF